MTCVKDSQISHIYSISKDSSRELSMQAQKSTEQRHFPEIVAFRTH